MLRRRHGPRGEQDRRAGGEKDDAVVVCEEHLGKPEYRVSADQHQSRQTRVARRSLCPAASAKRFAAMPR